MGRQPRGRPRSPALRPVVSASSTSTRGDVSRAGALALSTGTDVDNGTALAHLLRVAPVEVILDESAPLGFRVFENERELDETTLQTTK
jgi:hypothetical protein